MASRKEEQVELGFWQFVAAIASAVVADAPKTLVRDVGRPEASAGALFTQPLDVQKQIDELLAKSRAEQEAVVAEEHAKKMVTWTRILWATLIVVGGVVAWKEIKKRKAK